MKRKVLILIILMGITISMNFANGEVKMVENDVRLYVMQLDNNVTTVVEGESYHLIYGAKNFGSNPSEVADVKFYISNIPSQNHSSAKLLKETVMRPLDPGGSNTIGTGITISNNISSGTYYLIGVIEHQGITRTKVLTLTVETFINNVHLNVMFVNKAGSVVTDVQEGESYELVFGVKNSGNKRSELADVKFYLSNNYPLNINNARLLRDTGMGPLDPGRSNTTGTSITIPAEYSDGTSLLFGVVEHQGVKRYKIITLTVQFLPRPDLTSRLSIWNYRDYASDSYIVQQNELMVALGKIENDGNGTYYRQWGNYASFEVWKSTDNNLDFNSDEKMTLYYYSLPEEDIEPGGSVKSDVFLFSLGGTSIGETYYLFAVVDRENSVAELNEGNNISSMSKVLIIETPVRTPKTISRTTNIYPNPTDGLINFSNNQEKSRTYSLTDLSGRVIKEGVINSFEKLELNIRNEASGLYYLKIKSEDKEIELHKIVKN